MSGLHIVLREALADLACRAANDMIGGSVVIRRPAKNFDSDGSLFEMAASPSLRERRTSMSGDLSISCCF